MSKYIQKLLALCLITSLLLLSGCSLLPQKEPELSDYEKETSKRIYTLSKEMLALLNEKYPDVEFIEVGPASYNAEEMVFLFSTTDLDLEAGEMFSIEYHGDYLSPARPQEIKGRYQDNFAGMYIDQIFRPYAEKSIKEVFSGTLAEHISGLYLSWDADGDGSVVDGPEKNSPLWIAESFDTTFAPYFNIGSLMGEKANEARVDFSLYMFRDISKDNVEDLYQEIFDFASYYKALGIGEIASIEMSIYEEKWLSNGVVDLKTFDEEAFGYYVNANKVKEIVVDSRWTSVYDFDTIEEMKAQLYLAKIENGEKDIWLGGE